MTISLLLCLSMSGHATATDKTAMDDKLHAAFKKGELAGLHSVLVIHRGETIAESYFRGADERWGKALGTRSHSPETLHDLRSVTKSVVGLLYGIALADGKVPPVDTPLLSLFPGYADLMAEEARRKITIGHALSMTMGTEWNEDLPYTDPRNSEIAMELADDRYRYVLDRPMIFEPGEKWTYNGGATAIVAKLIADGVGVPIDTYAEEMLFAPLGIDRFEWIGGADGEPSAASGLRMRARDLARIGRLVLDRGKHGGREIVPAAWFDETLTPRATLDGIRYGYFWWLADTGDPPIWAAGFGNGGQRLTVQPAADVIVVVFAGNYNRPDAWRLPVKIIEKFVIPEIRKRLGGN